MNTHDLLDQFAIHAPVPPTVIMDNIVNQISQEMQDAPAEQVRAAAFARWAYIYGNAAMKEKRRYYEKSAATSDEKPES